MASIRKNPVITYSEVFGHDNDKPEHILTSYSKNSLQNLTTILLRLQSFSNKNDVEKVLTLWLGSNDPQLSALVDKIHTFEKASGTRVRILNPYSSLRILEILPTIKFNSSPPSKSNINLLKAYLKINEEYVSRFDTNCVASTKVMEPPYLKAASMALCASIKDFDYTNYNINEVFACEFIKSVYLFEYLASHTRYEEILRTLESRYGVKNYKDYILRIVGLVHFCLSEQNKNNPDRIKISHDINTSVFDDWAFNLELENDSLDFISLRNCPLIKIDEWVYQIVFDIFLVEKLFKGNYWLIKDLNMGLAPGNKINVQETFTFKFSEKKLLYRVLDESFSNDFIKLSGEQIDSSGLKGITDFYIRKDNTVFLFESKDIFLSAQSKVSGDFGLISSELRIKLVENQKQHPKALKQLLNSVKAVLEERFLLDPVKKVKHLKFAPIVVVHDRIFNALGLNVVLNYWMQELIEKDPMLFKHRHQIKGVTLIDINTLIFNASLLREGKVDLFAGIETYYKSFKYYSSSQAWAPHDLKSGEYTLLPFSATLQDQIKKSHKRSPKSFLQNALSL
jgi:hypothetical protein